MKRILDRLTSLLDPRLVVNVAVGAALALALFEGLKYVIGATVLALVLIRNC